jgi:protein-disulfide isomerase
VGGSSKLGFAMTHAHIPPTQPTYAVEPIGANIDHIRGQAGAPLILEYGDYECPYSRKAFRSIERVEARLTGRVRFAFRHFPLTAIHPHALAASLAAEAAALQDRFWEMHEFLFHRQEALMDDDLRRYAVELGLDVERFDRDRDSEKTRERVRRDVRRGIASGEVHGTPTLFINGVVHRGSDAVVSLLEALAR